MSRANAVCDGGLMIDLAPMKSIRVDQVARTARAEPGVLWGEFDRETQAFGLATTGGMISTTGIAGLTLGGGQGWLASKYGFAIDNLLSVDMVTADGQLLTASATQNEDLFWAVRGAGHNFGVVTSFEYRLYPVSTVLGGMIIHPFQPGDRGLALLPGVHRRSTRRSNYRRSHPDRTRWKPRDLHSSCAMRGHSTRASASWHRCAASDRPVADTVAPIPYSAHQTIFDEAFPYGRLNYWKSSLTDELSDEVIAAVVDYAGQMPSPLSAIVIGDYHGTYRRVGKTDTAYYHRDLRYAMIITAAWTDPVESEHNIRWTRELFQVLQPHTSGVYVNDLGEEGEERVRNAYGENYDRLVALKNQYDPKNFFRLNQNIKPTM